MRKIKLDALRLFTELKQQGARIAAYGAAAKGNTFLNYCGIKQFKNSDLRNADDKLAAPLGRMCR